MFKELCNKYYDKGIYTVPAMTEPSKEKDGKINKKPLVETGFSYGNAFNDHPITRFKKKWKKLNAIAILTDKVVVLDIDVTNPDFKKRILQIVEKYPTPVMKLGNRDKPYSLFYRANKDTEKKQPIRIDKDNLIELLYKGNCVIPPSYYGDGQHYQWKDKSLLEIGIDGLPEWNENLWKELCIEFNKEVNEKPKIESINTGRNDKIKSMISAGIFNQDSPDDIVKSVLDYDKKYHAIPLFEDLSEKICEGYNTPYLRAMKMYMNVAASIDKGDGFKLPCKIQIVEQKGPDFVEKAHKDRKWETKFEGVLGEIFDYIYERSPQPHTRFVIPSVLTLVSTVLGNKVRHNGTMANTFCIMIGTASSGKGTPLNIPGEILSEVGLSKYKGLRSISHPAQINALIERSPCRVDKIDEIHNLFRGMNSMGENPLKGAAEIYSELWDAPNKMWDGQFLVKEFKAKKGSGSTGECFSPYVNLIGACNIEMFTKHFNEDLAMQGFASRCLFFMDDTKKSKYNDDDSKPSWMNSRPVPQRIIDFINYCQGLTIFKAPEGNEPIDLTGAYEITNIQMSMQAEKLFINYCKKIESQAYKLSSEDAFMASVSRAERYFEKFAIMDAVSRSFETSSTPVIDVLSVKWAYNFVREYLIEAKKIFKVFIGSDERDQAIKKILDTIEVTGQTGISKRNLRRKYHRMTTPLFNEVTKTLIESGQIKEEITGKSTIYTKEN